MKTELKLENFEGSVLTILEGKALEEKHPVQIKIEGDINSVSSFLSKRNTENHIGTGLQNVDMSRAVVIVDEVEMTIKLFLDMQDSFGTEIVGKLLFTPELLQFHINTPKMFSRDELIKLLRFNKRFFASEDKFNELLKSYQKLEISSGSKVKAESDTRGNKNMLFDKTVNSENIPIEFTLRVPVFKGYSYELFRVEICLDVTDASVKFWFESVELAELIEIRKEEIFTKQLEFCQDFVIIHK